MCIIHKKMDGHLSFLRKDLIQRILCRIKERLFLKALTSYLSNQIKKLKTNSSQQPEMFFKPQT